MAKQPRTLFQQLDDQTKANWSRWTGSLTARSQQVMDQLVPAPAAPSEQPWWYLLLVPEMAEPELHEFSSVAQVAEALRSRVDERDLKVYIFIGWRAHVSTKPFRYLIDPRGPAYPLFTLPDEIEIQADNRLGPEPEIELTSTIGDDLEEEVVEEEWTGDEEEAELESEEVEEPDETE